MEKIDKEVAEILSDYMLEGDAMLTSNRLKELFGYKALAHIDERRKAFADTLRPHVDTYGSEMITEFYVYWASCGARSKLIAFEKEKSFNLPQRLSTWFKNGKRFSIVGMIKTKGLTL